MVECKDYIARKNMLHKHMNVTKGSTRIIGISGKKQAGKNTSANFLHGLVLKEKGLIKDFNISKNGELSVQTTNQLGEEGWGIFDIMRKDSGFIEYAENSMWPFVKLYSFADTLKWICVELFDLTHEQVYGTDEQKNTPTNVMWEDVPDRVKAFRTSGPMTAREFMQYFGTNVMRKMYENIWVNNTIKRVHREQTELAIIADIRFPNEAEVITENGGEVIRLTRDICEDQHASECALDAENFDQSKFNYVINNHDTGIDMLCNQLKNIYHLGRV